MAHGSLKLRPVSVLRCHRMLAHSPFQPHLWPSGYFVHYLLLFCYGLSLARICQLMVAHVYCEILLGIRNWPKICYLPHLRSRDLSSPNQRSLGDAIPNVDSIWYNAWIHRRPSLFQSFRRTAYPGTKLAVDDVICHAPRCGSLLLCVYGTRIAALGTLHARHIQSFRTGKLTSLYSI